MLKYNISTQSKIDITNKRYIRKEWALKVYGWLKLFWENFTKKKNWLQIVLKRRQKPKASLAWSGEGGPKSNGEKRRQNIPSQACSIGNWILPWNEFFVQHVWGSAVIPPFSKIYIFFPIYFYNTVFYEDNEKSFHLKISLLLLRMYTDNSIPSLLESDRNAQFSFFTSVTCSAMDGENLFLLSNCYLVSISKAPIIISLPSSLSVTDNSGQYYLS